MARKYFLIAGIVWLVLVAFGLYYYNKPRTAASDLETDARIDAVDLYGQYQKDENASNRKFLGKIIEVKGKVTNLQQSGNTTSILLDGGSSSGGINCSITNNDSIQLPAKGSTVTVKGKCSGFLMDVNLSDCAVEK